MDNEFIYNANPPSLHIIKQTKKRILRKNEKIIFLVILFTVALTLDERYLKTGRYPFNISRSTP